MRALPALLAFLAATSAAAAGPWLTAPVANLQGGDSAHGLALGADGNGYLATWDGATLSLHVLRYTLTEGPTLAVAQTWTTLGEPTLAYDGANVLVGGDFSGQVQLGAFGQPLASTTTNLSGSSVRAVAIDRAGSRRSLVALNNGGVLDNAAHAADGTAFVPLEVGSPTDELYALAVWQNDAVAVSDLTLYRTTDADAGSWTPMAGVPVDLNTRPRIAVNTFGEFLAVGANGSAIYLADAGAASFGTCTVGGAGFTAVTTEEGAFWLGRADGTVEAVDVSGGCPWTGIEPVRPTGLDSVDALAVTSSRAVLALGPTPSGLSLVWRNRPPLTPSIAGGGDVDEQSTATATVTEDDPDLDANADDPPGYAWTCDPALAATDTDTPTVSVTLPNLCVDPALPGSRVNLACTAVTTDSDAQQSPPATVTFAVLRDDAVAPTVLGVTGLADGAAVLTGTLLTLSANATDDNPACLDQATWTVRDQATGTVRQQLVDDLATPFTFTATTLGTDQVTSYTLELVVTDSAGNSATLAPFSFTVGLPQPPVLVDLTCPLEVEAGATGTATATPRRDSGTVVDYQWLVGGAALAADAAPTDETFTFQADVCGAGDNAIIRMVPHGVFEDGPSRLCTVAVLESSSPPPPLLTVAEAPVLAVTLGERGLAATLHPSVDACVDRDILVRWDLSALPSALRREGTDPSGGLALDRGAPLSLAAGPELFAALEGMELVVRATAIDRETEQASVPVDIALRFAADPALVAVAGVDVSLATVASGAIDEGELVGVTGTIATDVVVALPRLTVALAGDGLVPVPGSVVVTSACGASATVAQQGPAALLTLEGVSAGCPAQLSLLARRGLGAGGLRARDCAWGPAGTPLSRCDGGLSIDAPPALSCAGGATPPLSLFALLLMVGARGVALAHGRHRRSARR